MEYQISKNMFRDYYSDAMIADEIIIKEDTVTDTGILDEYGNRILKVNTREPVGYI